MRKGCEAFIGQWSEQVEMVFLKRENNESVEQQLCVKKTKACLGVDMTQKQ